MSFLRDHPHVRWVAEHLVGLWVALVLTPSVVALIVWAFLSVAMP